MRHRARVVARIRSSDADSSALEDPRRPVDGGQVVLQQSLIVCTEDLQRLAEGVPVSILVGDDGVEDMARVVLLPEQRAVS